MPEGDTIHRLAARLRPILVDREVTSLRAHRIPGEALLVQSATAGIGNVYKSEVLFLEGLDPRARVSSLDDAALRAVVRRASPLLRRNLGDAPRSPPGRSTYLCPTRQAPR